MFASSATLDRGGLDLVTAPLFSCGSYSFPIILSAWLEQVEENLGGWRFPCLKVIYYSVSLVAIVPASQEEEEAASTEEEKDGR